VMQVVNNDSNKVIADERETTRVPTPCRKKMDAVDRLVAVIKDLAAQKFTGYLKLNFSQGSLARVEKFEEILK